MPRELADTIALKCAECSGEFSRPRWRIRSHANYCSRKCYRDAMSARNYSSTLPDTVVKCDWCKIEFTRTRKHIYGWERRGSKYSYCSRECASKGKTVANLTVNHNANSRSNIRHQMIRCGKLVSCETCGYSKNRNILQIHHRDRNKANNAMENLAVLCPNCHAEEHYGDGREYFLGRRSA